MEKMSAEEMVVILYGELLEPKPIFDRNISKDSWEILQKLANHKLETYAKHWQSIVDGKVPNGITIVD